MATYPFVGYILSCNLSYDRSLFNIADSSDYSSLKIPVQELLILLNTIIFLTLLLE